MQDEVTDPSHPGVIQKATLTGTDGSGILPMLAVVHEPAIVGAQGQEAFLTTAAHVVQENPSKAWAKVGTKGRRQGWAAPKLPAHDLGLPQAPAVITH